MSAERRRAPRAVGYAISLLALIAVAAVFGAAGSSAIEIPIPDVNAFFSGRVSPMKLPARGAAPVRLALTEEIESLSGAHPPALQELDLDLDRHLGLSVKDLPRCGPRLQESPTRGETLSQCEDAKVGSGTLTVEAAFPEQPPFQVGGRVSIYNAGARGARTTFWVYVYLHAPVTGAILMPLEVRRESRGTYGWSGTLEVPKIANGAASVTHFGIRFRKGVFSASCPTGKLQNRALARFADGSVASGASIRRCSTVAASG